MKNFMENTTQAGEGNTGSFNYVCLMRITKMCDARAENDIEKYFIHFTYSLKMVLSSIPKEKRELIEADWKYYRKLKDEIEDTIDNEQTKKTKLLRLKEDFADAHEYYVFDAFSRVGILRVADDGILDLTNRNPKDIAGIIRNQQYALSKVAAEYDLKNPPKPKIDEEQPKATSD